MATSAVPLSEHHHPERVVIADPHPTVRRALARVVEHQTGATVAAQVADLAAAGMAVRQEHADVLVIDERLYGANGDGLGVIPASTRLVVAGMEDDPMVVTYYESGRAEAYVVKDQAHLRLPELLSPFACG